ncbi:MAG: TolC family outer membrane protein [Gammaproteobacteria bacterium]|nr:TolC family outer membrane protein [Gammaproteobacteria bacterium]
MSGFSKNLVVTVLLLFSRLLEAAAFEEVVSIAVANSPDVLQARNQQLAIAGEVRQAEAGYLPTIDLNAGIGYEYTDSPSTRPNDDEELERAEFGLSLRQNIFNGLATEAEVERQQARLETAEHRLLATANDVALSVSEEYLNVLKFREILDLAQENRQVHQRIQDQIRLRSEAGVGRGADYDQINARVSLVEANLVAANVNLQDAETGYKRVVGQEPEEQMAAVPDLSQLIPATLEEALALSESGNFTYKSSASDVLEAQAQHKASRSNHYPTVDFELSSNLNNDLDGTDGYNNDVTAMLRLRYNLYNGGADVAAISSTANRVLESQEIRNRSYRQVEQTLRLAWAAYQATTRQIELLQKQVDYSIDTRDAYVKQFNIGQRTLLDLLNTENELFQAKQSLVSARTDNLFAQYRILAVMGRIVESINVNLAKVLPAAQ